MNPVPIPLWIAIFACIVLGLTYGLYSFLDSLAERWYGWAAVSAGLVFCLSLLLRFWWLVGFGV